MNKLHNTDTQIVKYLDGEIEINVQLEEETVWITQKQLADLFEVEVHTINYHIKNIFRQKELNKNSTIRKIRMVQKEGKREVVRNIEHYNLDIIISVGYRVNSIKATKFRQWAAKVLKQYIINGYAINSERITVDRFLNLEKDVISLKDDMHSVNKLITNKTRELKQGIFYDGQIYDAYVFINDLLKEAKKEVILIDNYIDNTILTLFSKYPNINFTIITKNISKQLELDIDKYNSQYKNVIVKTSNKFHDRFLLIDNKDAYHIGASLKDLGKKVFGFSKIDIELLRIVL
jgi:hypothetical protein